MGMRIIRSEKFGTIKVVSGKDIDKVLTESDREMDYRAQEAVKAAIKKAKVCKAPIARYDSKTKRAYLEFPNGERKYCDE